MLKDNVLARYCDERPLIAIFVLALLLRLIFVLCIPHRVFYPDTQQYQGIAVNLVQGNGYAIEAGVPTARRVPVYPFFLAAVYYLFGVSPLAVLLLQSVIGALTCVFTAKIAREVFDEKAARLAGALAAAHPVLISYSGVLLSECLFTLLLAMMAWALLTAFRERRVVSYFVSGILFGATYLTRPDLLVFAVLLAGVVFYLYSFRPRALYHLAVLAAGFALVFAPWAVRNYRVFHYVFVAQADSLGPTTWGNAMCIVKDSVNYEFWPDTQERIAEIMNNNDPATVEKITMSIGLAILKKHPLKFAGILLRRLPHAWITSNSSMFGIERSNNEYLREIKLVPLAVKGALLALQVMMLALTAAGTWLSRHKFDRILILLVLIAYSTIYVYCDTSARHNVPYFPYLLVFCGAAIAHVCASFRKSADPTTVAQSCGR
jgi:4-amino-4-deoxy-L-arabinose transferase-like glycosyltransferase